MRQKALNARTGITSNSLVQKWKSFQNIIFRYIFCLIPLAFQHEMHWNVFLRILLTTKNMVQIMAWCHQGTSHYLNPCRPRSTTPCGIARPQSAKSFTIHREIYAQNLHFVVLWYGLAAVLYIWIRSWRCGCLVTWALVQYKDDILLV